MGCIVWFQLRISLETNSKVIEIEDRLAASRSHRWFGKEVDVAIWAAGVILGCGNLFQILTAPGQHPDWDAGKMVLRVQWELRPDKPITS